LDGDQNPLWLLTTKWGNVIVLGKFLMKAIFKQLKSIKNLVTKDITFSIIIQKGLIVA
jgi:hypothetical protein